MSRTAIRLLLPVMVLTLLASMATAGDFNDWDDQEPGPYLGAGDVLEGAADCVTVIDAGEEPPAPLVPNGNGRVLCIDARSKPSRIIIEFTVSCDVEPNSICVIKHDFSGYNTTFGSGGYEVHVDAAGDYSNADDLWAPVGLPPQQTFGSNTEGAGACDGNVHTIAIMVKPGTLLYIDNLRTECNPPVPVEQPHWSRIKSLFR